KASTRGRDRRAGRWGLQENRGVACSALAGATGSRANRPAIGASLTISAGPNRRLANGSAQLRIVCSRLEGLSRMMRARPDHVRRLQACEPNAPAQIYCNPALSWFARDAISRHYRRTDLFVGRATTGFQSRSALVTHERDPGC